MKLSEAYLSDATLRRIFTWLTKIQAGRKFGSIPIAWYQAHQCACIDILKENGADVVRCKFGHIQTQVSGKWHTVMSAIDLWQKADIRARR